MSGKKKVALTLKDKLHILNSIRKKKATKLELCDKFKCSVSTINRILQKENILKEVSKSRNLKTKRLRDGAFPDIDRALTIWFDEMRRSGGVLSTTIIMEKAKQFAIQMDKDFNPTLGWLWRWQKREGIASFKKIHKDIKNTNSISNYNDSDIFNANESGLFFRALPSKLSKEHLTLCFICNATGDYKKIIVIGKTKNPNPRPRCFQNKILPLKYYSNSKAWMCNEIWEHILQTLDSEMKKENRKIILFVANVACHRTSKSFSNINLQFLPSGLEQPLNQGIIDAFKVYYRQIIVRRQVLNLEKGKTEDEFVKSVTVLNALQIVKHAWWLVTEKTVKHCFIKAKFLNHHDENVDDIEINENVLNEDFKNYVSIDKDLECYGPLTDEYIVSEINSNSEIKIDFSEDDNENLKEDNKDTIEDNEDFSDDNENSKEDVRNIKENVPNTKEVLASLNTLRNYFSHKNKFIEYIELMEQEIFNNLDKKSVDAE